MKKETLGNMKRFLAVLLTVVLMGSSLQPAREVFATEGSGVESGTELETETTMNQTGEGETEAASGSALEVGANVQEEYPELYLELDPVQTSAMARSFWGLRNDGTVDLIDGTAVNWIDRVDTTSADTAFIKTLYNALVEASDDDGVEDYLIEDQYFEDTNGKIDNKLEVATVEFVYPSSTENPVTESQFREALGNVLNEKLELYANYIVVGYDAFDRDHPEVFWLSGGTSIGATYDLNGGSEATGWKYSMTFYFWLQRVDAPNTTDEDESFDIRAEQYNTQELIEAGISKVNISINEILSSEKVVGKTNYEKIKYFNNWLIKNNQYNTIVAAGGTGASGDCWECISALVGTDGSVTGRIGEDGPVCEGYARAFKVLCDKAVIPCVLVDGTAVTSSGSSGPHMWNYAQVDGAWYGVDVTWNDPAGGETETAVSGNECDAWLLVGANTEIGGRAFCAAESPETSSHPVENCLRDNGVAFTNGPVLSETAYTAPVAGVATVTNGSTVNTYGTFTEALANWTDGTTLTLLTSVTHDSTIEIVDKSVTLDLNGKMLDMSTVDGAINIGKYDTESHEYLPSALTICDSGTDGSIDSAETVIFCETAGKLTLQKGKLQGSISNSGTFHMTDGSIIALDNQSVVDNDRRDATFHISGGILEGRYGIWNTNGTVEISGTPVIKGKDYDTYNGGAAIVNAYGTMTISDNPTLEGGSQGDFNVTEPITFATVPTGDSTWSVYMDEGDIGCFAIPAEGVTLDASRFISKVEGYEVFAKEDGSLYLAKPITDGMVTRSGEPATYNGNDQMPTVTVKDSETTLTKDTDYKVTIQQVNSDNTLTTVTEMKNAGTYRVTITGIGTYGGEITKTFTIDPATLTVTGATATDREYDGTANVTITAVTVEGIFNSDAVSVNVTADGVALTGTVSSANAGTYTTVTLPTLTLTGDAAGNYIVTQPAGAVSLTADVTISPKSVTPTLEGLAASYVHTGEAIEPTFTLKNGETEIPASEYTVSYNNNTAIGTATITISDAAGGNYTVLNVSKTFIITDHVHNWTYSAEGAVITASCDGAGLCPANNTATITLAVQEGSIVFDGTSKTASVTQNPANTFANVSVSYKDAAGTTLTLDPVDAGTYTASITMGEGTAAATAGVEFTIEPENLNNLLFWGPENGGASLTLDKDSYVYTGSEIKPVPTITWNNMTLVEGTDYTLKYFFNINAGEETASMQITGIGNYAVEGDYNYWFTIEKADYTPAATEANLTQNYTKVTFTVNLDDVVELPENPSGRSYAVSTGTDATIAEDGQVLTATITDGVAGAIYSFPVIVTTGNYKNYTFTIKLTLTEKNDQTISWNMDKINAIELTYGGSPINLSDYIIDGEGSGAITYTVGSVDGIGEATISGSVLTPVSAGEIYLIAHKAADEDYNAATSEKVTLYIVWIRPTGSMTFSKVTEAGTMLSDVEVTVNYLDVDGNVLEGTIQWYERVENGHSPINSPETFEVQQGVEYNCEFRPTNTNYSWMAEDVILWSSHTWTYTVDGPTITATCSKHEDCVVVMSMGTIGTLVYDGTEQEVIIDNESSNLLEAPHVFYEKKNGEAWEVVNGIPVDAGTYCAFFTLGGKTAYLEYTVAKAALDTSGIVITFKSSVTNDEGNAVGLVNQLEVPDGYRVYFSTSTNNRTWSDWTETEPTMSQPGTLYVKAKVVLDDNHEEYVTAVSKVRMTDSSASSGTDSSGDSGYYPPYYPSYPSYPTYPTVTPTPAPTATPVPTVAPTEAPKPTEVPVPTVTPVPGTVMVESSGNVVVDEKGEEITSIIQEPGTTNKLNVPGLTDIEGAEPVWKSTNPDVAEVDENGNVTLKAPGLAEVVVTVGEGEDAKTETIVVYVEEPRTYVNPVEEAFKDVRLGTSWGDIPLVRYQAVGETIDINFWGVKNWEKDNYDYVWQTSDKSVATVDSKGRITAVKPGVVSLTLGLKNKKTGNLLNVQSVEVVIPGNSEEKILLGTSRNDTFDSIELKLNERIDINFYGVKNWKKDEYEYHWSSSEPSVVYVDNVGKLTPVSPGKAEVFLVLIEKKTGAPKQVIPVSVTVPEKEAK